MTRRLPVKPAAPIADHSWRRRGLCVGHPNPDLWFPDKKTDPEARRICSHCPVQRECGTHALNNAEPEGIWAGRRIKNGRFRR